MAEEHFTTTPEKNAPSPPPAEAITPSSEEGESSRSSRKGNYWGDDYTEVLMGLDQIKALADLLTETITSAIDSFAEHHPGIALFEGMYNETLPTIGHLIQEKAERTKTLVQEAMG